MNGLVSISDFKMVPPEYISETYKLGSSICNSSTTVLRKARDLRTNDKKLIQVISRYSVITSQMENKLASEVSAMLILDHPNIIRVSDYFQDEINYYIVTERFFGGDLLLKLIVTQDHSELTCKVYLQQIFSALSALEEKNIVHRNIKLENFIFFSDTLKLVNFNFCRILAPFRKTNENKIGTPYYMAPEVINGEYDTKSDVWSAGVIFYFILSGKFPFEGLSTREIYATILASPVTFRETLWERVSDSGRDLLEKIFVKDPDLRISATQALQHQWFRDLHHELPSSGIAKPIVANLLAFKAKENYKKAVLRYASLFIITNSEKEELLQMFRSFDTDNNGSLSKNELKEGFVKIFGNRIKNPEKEAEKIISEVDLDHSGEISYSEFVLAAVNRKKLTQKKNLEEIFARIDTQHHGFIDANDLNEAFSRNLIHQQASDIEEMIRECDSDHDGRINLADFTALMLKN